MIDPNLICINCMREKPDSGICPFCGFDESQYKPSPHQIPPHSIRAGRYFIGCVLGEDGFGITYAGFDQTLGLKVAIKEYYPAGCITRTCTASTIATSYYRETIEYFTEGRSRFINEAKTLAKFNTLPGIVPVRASFLENGTAYIVMEFAEGETLKQHLVRSGGKMRADEVLELVKPLLRSLAQIHAAGLIHRDISPDNIMITPEGNAKLIDFGVARDYLDRGGYNQGIMLRPGYAPEELYSKRGTKGPWTDIYALCATIYRAITGITPPEAFKRQLKDELKTPSALGVCISPAQEAALLKGMATSQRDRWQTTPGFFEALYSETFEHPDAARNTPVAPSPQKDRLPSSENIKEERLFKMRRDQKGPTTETMLPDENKRKYPMINRDDFDRDNSGSTEIGWAEGVLSDNRPYRLECWAEDHITSITIFISAIDIEDWSSEQVMGYLEAEGLYSKTNMPFHGSARLYQSGGKTWWSANIVIGDDGDQLYADSKIPLKPYKKS